MKFDEINSVERIYALYVHGDNLTVGFVCALLDRLNAVVYMFWWRDLTSLPFSASVYFYFYSYSFTK